MAESLNIVAEQFDIGTIESFTQIGAGHIHNTLRVKTSEGEYIVQQFNDQVFTSPYIVESNYLTILPHLKGFRHFKAQWQLAQPNKIFISVNDQLYRVCPYIVKSKSYEVVQSALMASEIARAFALFIQVLPPDQLHIREPIPNFLDPKLRWDQFQQALSSKIIKDEIIKRLINDYTQTNPLKEYQYWIERLPKRIIHGDTKTSNVLFDEHDQVLSIIDLDTVMPGYSICDFGDLVRSNCGLQTEDDPKEFIMNESNYQALREGFISIGGWSSAELDALSFGAKLMTWLTGIRFLTDHLNGDIYYGVSRPNQNLDRSQNQMNLLKQIIK